MSLIYVRTLPGRVAFDQPRGGKKIPTDRFVAVEHNQHVRRLIDFHGDVEVQKEKAPAKAEPAPPAPVAAAKPTKAE